MFRWLGLFGVIAACGDGMTVPDASVPPDTQLGLVTVKVRSRMLGDGARVFFQRSDSSLVLVSSTDASGFLQAYIPPHVFVTVELVDFAEGRIHHLFTQADVNPGDEVNLDDGSVLQNARVSITVPEDVPGSFYTVLAPCQVSPIDPLLPDQAASVFFTGCDSPTSVMVQASNGYLRRKNVAIVDGGSILFSGAYEPFGFTRLGVTNVPESVHFIEAKQVLLDGPNELYPDIRTGFQFDGFETSAEATLSSPIWSDAQAITKVTAYSNTVSTTNVYEWGPRGETTTIDVSTEAVRSYRTRPYYSPNANLVGWIESDRGRLADAVLVEMSWFGQNGNDSATVDWKLFARRGEEAWVTMPVLPDPLLQPRDAFVNGVTNFAIDGGYERLRKLPLLGQWHDFQGLGATWPIDAPTGRVTFQSLGTGGGIPD